MPGPTPPSTPAADAVRWACVGLGGYAGKMSDLLADMAAAGRIRYAAACDPSLGGPNAERVAQLRDAGVAVHDHLSALLAGPADAVWLPVPIDLHRPFTHEALARGKAVLCEKPAAGAPADIDAMIAARDAARLPVAIGFQHLYDPAMAAIKSRLAGGLIGRIRRATALVAWPRDDHYYARNTWAARWRRGDTWVLDSPANNAMAHYLHLALFLLGDAPESSATPVRVQAEHYRANPIETYDTTALRITLSSGVELLVYLTHAACATIDPRLTLTGDRGTLTLDPEHHARAAGTPEPFEVPLAAAGDLRRNMVATVSAAVRGQPLPTPLATLENARAQSLVVAASIQAAPVIDVPDHLIDATPTPGGGTLRAIRGIGELLQRCAGDGRLPAETGAWPWAAPARALDLTPGWAFTGPAQA